ncbi:MAG: aminotransferase class V-fold PLP-dependent enzyme [Armatimonadota bacterium]
MTLELDINAAREVLPVTRHCIYMNTGTSGPCPRPAVEAMAGLHTWINSVGPSSPDAKTKGDEVTAQLRTALASLLNCTPKEIALTHNTSEGVNIVLTGLDIGPGDEIIVTDLEHDSVLVPVYHMCARTGAVWRMLALSTGADPVSALAEAITPRTKLVAISHIAFSNGRLLPIREMASVARAAGVPVLVDGAQGPGHIPVDVRELGVQFYALPGQKWLLGPDGTGALYICSEWLERLRPQWVGWASHRGYDLDGGYRLREDARRFEVGTMDPCALLGMLRSVEFLQEVGLPAVHARIAHLAARLRRMLADIHGVEVKTPPKSAESGLVAFTVVGMEPRAVVAELYRLALVVCRWIPPPFPPVVRVSVNFFQTEEELHSLCECLARLAQASH